MVYIIGIGGVRASGKTTIARNLGLSLEADIVSCGRTREVVRTLYQNDNPNLPNYLPELFESVTRAPSLDDSVRHLVAQSEILRPYFKKIIERSHEINLIIEGTHIYPGLYCEELDLEVFLTAPIERIKRHSNLTKRRKFTEQDIQRSIELQEYLREEAEKHGVPVIDTTSFSEAIIRIIKLLPDKD